MSALQPLERIRSETRVETSELWSMTRLGYQAGEHDVQDARRKNKPFLQSLRALFIICSFSATAYIVRSRGHSFTVQVHHR